MKNRLQSLLLILSLQILVVFNTNASILQQQDSLLVFPVVVHILHDYGQENISDEQVRDAIADLNRRYQKKNSDTNHIPEEFRAISGNMQIEFRLATKDPNGNCTNGIERIATPETRYADDNITHTAWDQRHYINIWVVEVLKAQSDIGHTYMPEELIPGKCFADGIIMIHSYMGSIGTSTVFCTPFLANYMGHYLGLKNTFGTATFGECGDDGITDTPVCSPNYSCGGTMSPPCNPGIKENINNYMAFSYCMGMFTKGQVKFVRESITNPTNIRYSLIQHANRVATGTDTPNGPSCAPIADFMLKQSLYEINDQVFIVNASTGSDSLSFEWSFPEGTPATSTERVPSVKYATSGLKTIHLTVKSGNLSTTLTKENVVYINPRYADRHGPHLQNFDGDDVYYLTKNQPGTEISFQRLNNAGVNQSKGWKLNAHQPGLIDYGCEYENDYYHTLKGADYELYTESYNLSNTSNVSVSFDYAYTELPQVTEDSAWANLTVYSTKKLSFGAWTKRKEIKNSELLTQTAQVQSFEPTSANQWKTIQFNYPANSGDTNTRFKFVMTLGGHPNNLYIDNFQVSGLLKLPVEPWQENIRVSPNPVIAGNSLNLSLGKFSNPIQMKLVGVNGQEILNQEIAAEMESVNVLIPSTVKAGYYFIQLSDGQSNWTEKVIIIN